MIYASVIVNLKSDILDLIGHKILFRGSLGRNKFFEKEATVDKVYSNIFTVKYNEGIQNATYSYTDVLTRTVELKVLDDNNTYCSLMPPIDTTPKRRRVINR